MKKLFTAVPMKKLLLATSLVAMSSAAIAANTSEELDAEVTDDFTVSAKYVTPISVGLDTISIDFGDVWTDSAISVATVVATVEGETGETFTYSVETDGDYAELLGDLTGEQIGFDLEDTSKKLTFTVGLNTDDAETLGTISETITVKVNYDDIADTDVVRTPVT
jgi:opacity protein-like surface antigen